MSLSMRRASMGSAVSPGGSRVSGGQDLGCCVPRADDITSMEEAKAREHEPSRREGLDGGSVLLLQLAARASGCLDYSKRPTSLDSFCEEPPKLSRLNQVIIHWSTQLKRDNPGSLRYAPWATPRINSHTVCSRHSNHHKYTYESKILNFWLQVLFILQKLMTLTIT